MFTLNGGIMTENLDPFEIAVEQLGKAAKIMKLDKQAFEILKSPQQILQVSLPVRMDSRDRTVFAEEYIS